MDYISKKAIIYKRNNTKRSHVTFTQFLPVVTSFKTIVQNHCQDIDIDSCLLFKPAFFLLVLY